MMFQVSVSSAEKGDIVLVIWSEEHQNYQIYNESSSLHFLHTEGITGLGLKDARRKQVTAEVVDKEYCQVNISFWLVERNVTYLCLVDTKQC